MLFSNPPAGGTNSFQLRLAIWGKTGSPNQVYQKFGDKWSGQLSGLLQLERIFDN